MHCLDDFCMAAHKYSSARRLVKGIAEDKHQIAQAVSLGNKHTCAGAWLLASFKGCDSSASPAEVDWCWGATAAVLTRSTPEALC